MKEEEIRRYAELMQELNLQRLSVTEKGTTICLERPRGEMPMPSAAAKETPAPKEQEADIISVTSPMVGVFYAAPAENADAFVSVGDRIEEGDTLCIIEAMKLMNEIRAEASGVVTKVCVTNGQVVEYGTELFRIRREQADGQK